LIVEALGKLVRRESLTEEESAAAMRTLMAGDATPAQIAGFMVALRVKGETAEEITGMARAAREQATPIPLDGAGLLDVVGTGGDGTGTFNISTVSAIVAAGAGARVAKHGNRAASSQCGSADVLEALGVRIDLSPEAAAGCLEDTGITFLFAPLYHPSFRHASVPRRELGVRTFFNILGPLCNPAGARLQALGVADGGLADLMADVLARLGVRRALVFHGSDGMDELSLAGPSRVVEVLDGNRREEMIDPGTLGLGRALLDDVRGGDAAANAQHARDVLGGATGPRRDIVLLNSAAALMAAGIAADWRHGVALAAESIDQGRAAGVLDRWIRASQQHAVSA
jgi:anthranilate phosphoribosyltransferase